MKSYKGRLLGSLIGLFLGGPFGVIIGFLLGWIFVDSPRRRVVSAHGQARQAFTYTQGYNDALIYSTFALLGYVARGGGVIRREQISLAEQCMNMMQIIDPASRSKAQEAFSRGKSQDFDLQTETAELRRILRSNTGVIAYLLEILVQMALVDGVVQEEEHRRLCEIAVSLGVSRNAMERLIQVRLAEMRFRNDFYDWGNGRGQNDNYSGSQNNGNGSQYDYGHSSAGTERSATLKGAYEILGVSPETSWEEVRKAHKRLMLKYHPDRLKSQGVPDEMIRTYTEKAKDIQAAFDCIKRARGEKN